MCDCIFNESCEYLVELALHHQKALNKIILLMLLSARNCVSVAAKGRCCTLCLAPAFLSYLKLFKAFKLPETFLQHLEFVPFVSATGDERNSQET